MTTKTISGVIQLSGLGEADDSISVSEVPDTEKDFVLAEMVGDLISEFGNTISARYFIADRPLTLDQCTEALVSKLYGHTEAEYEVVYSECTGYLWTTEDLTIGGHDLIAELSSHIGKYLVLELDFSPRPN